MISEGSCDTEEWRNDAENSVLPTQENLKNNNNNSNIKNINFNNITQYY